MGERDDLPDAFRLGKDGRYAVLSVPPVVVTRRPELTDAEHAVVILVCRGLSNQEIANHRKTSARTVANQLQCVYRKLGVHDRYALISRCLNR